MNEFDVILKNLIGDFDELKIITDYNFYTVDGVYPDGILETPLYEMFCGVYDDLYLDMIDGIHGVSDLIEYTVKYII